MQESTSVQSASADGFDLDAWYASAVPQALNGVHPALRLVKALGKDPFETRVRFLYPEGHPREFEQNGVDKNGKPKYRKRVLKGFLDRDWQDKYPKYNEQGRRVYFVVNRGGDRADDISDACALFAEWDRKHHHTVEDILNRDWAAFGFPEPTALVFSGSWSAHAYWAIEGGTQDLTRWRVAMYRLAQVLNSDSSITDSCRLMRLPGFFNATADGVTERRSLLLQADPERRYSLDELDNALTAFEEKHGLSAAASLSESYAFEVKHWWKETYGDDGLEELKTYFNLTARPTQKRGEHAFCDPDERSLEEIANALKLIPPYIAKNNTYKGEEPVETADGVKVHISYFKLLAGLANALENRGLDPVEKGLELLEAAWGEGDDHWRAGQLSGSDGKISSRSFWFYAGQCGYQLTKPNRSNDASAESGGSMSGFFSKPELTVEERAELIAENMQRLYETTSAVGDSFDTQESLFGELYKYGLNRDIIQKRILSMIGIEFGFNCGGDQVEREAIPADEVDLPTEDQLPGLLIAGRTGVFVANAGAGKTTIAAICTDAVVTGKTIPGLLTGPVKRTGRVLYIASDGGVNAIPTVKRYARRVGVPLEPHGDKVIFFGANKKRKQNSWSFTARDIRKLVETLEKYKDDPMPIRLVVIDTLHSVMDLAGVSSGIGPMNEAMRLLGDIAGAYDAGILLMHHTLKGNEDVAGGHAALTQVPESVVFMHKLDRDYEGEPIREVEVRKHRNGMDRKVELVIKNDVGIKPVPPASIADLDNLILSEMWDERDDGSTPRSIARYLKHLGYSEDAVVNRMAIMRKLKLLRCAKQRWFLSVEAMERAKEQNQIATEIAMREDGIVPDTPATADDLDHDREADKRAHMEVLLAQEETRRRIAEEDKLWGQAS